jgi:hypothetical protein
MTMLHHLMFDVSLRLQVHDYDEQAKKKSNDKKSKTKSISYHFPSSLGKPVGIARYLFENKILKKYSSV